MRHVNNKVRCTPTFHSNVFANDRNNEKDKRVSDTRLNQTVYYQNNTQVKRQVDLGNQSQSYTFNPKK